MGDIFEDEDKTIDFLSKKRERNENSEELGENKKGVNSLLFQFYS